MSSSLFVCYREVLASSCVVASTFFRSKVPKFSTTVGSTNSHGITTTSQQEVLEEFLAVFTVSTISIYRIRSDKTKSLNVGNETSVTTVQTEGEEGTGTTNGGTGTTTNDNLMLELLRTDRLYAKVSNVAVYSRSPTTHIDTLSTESSVDDMMMILDTPLSSSSPENMTSMIINDVLVIAFDEGKLIAVEYLPSENRFLQSIIGNLEERASGVGAEIHVLGNGRNNFLGHGKQGQVRVHSEYKLLASSLYGEHLFLASFASEPSDGSLSYWNSPSALGSFLTNRILVDLNQVLGINIPIVDIAFVHGYARPAIAILTQELFLPIGHAAKVRHTCTVTVVSVDVDQKSVAVLWKHDRLPHDSLRLVELSSGQLAGCVCVVSQNAVCVVREECIHAVAMNGFAGITVDVENIFMTPWTTGNKGYELDGSEWIERSLPSQGVDTQLMSGASETTLLGILRDGTVLQVHLQQCLPEVESSLLIEAVVLGVGVSPTCVAVSSDAGKVFIGVRNGEATLYRTQLRNPVNTSSGTAVIGRGGTATSLYDVFSDCVFLESPHFRTAPRSLLRKLLTDEKRRRRIHNHNNSLDNKEAEEEEEEEEEEEVFESKEEERRVLMKRLRALIRFEEESMYGDQTHKMISGLVTSQSWILRLLPNDVIPISGSILDGTFSPGDESFSLASALDWERGAAKPADPPLPPEAKISESDARLKLITTTGVSQDTALQRISSGIALGKVSERSFVGCVRVDSLVLNRYSILALTYKDRTRILQCCEVAGSRNSGSNEVKLREMSPDDSGFDLTRPTLRISSLFSSTSAMNSALSRSGLTLTAPLQTAMTNLAVQITRAGVKLVNICQSFGDANDPLQEMLLNEAVERGGLGGIFHRNADGNPSSCEWIVSGDVSSNGDISLLTSLHNMYFLRYSPVQEALEIVACHPTTSESSNSELPCSEQARNSGATLFSELTSDIVSVSCFGETLVTVPTNVSFEANSSNTYPLGLSKAAAKAAAVEQSIEEQRRAEEMLMYSTTVEESAPVTSQPPLVPPLLRRHSSAGTDYSSSLPTATVTKSFGQPRSHSNLLVITERDGHLTLLNTVSGKVVVRTRAFTAQSESVPLTPDSYCDAALLGLSEADLEDRIANRFIIEARLERLRYGYTEDTSGIPTTTSGVDKLPTRLVMFLVFHTGELCVYSAFEDSVTGAVTSFNLVAQQVLWNRRHPGQGGRNKASTQSNAVVPGGAPLSTVSVTQRFGLGHSRGAANVSYLQSDEYLQRLPTLSGVIRGHATEGVISDCVLLSGPTAYAVSLVRGLPVLSTLAFPELPFVNLGRHGLFVLASRGISLIGTLWTEDRENDSSSRSAANKARDALLSLYRILPRQTISSNGGLSLQSLRVGQTVLSLDEILPITDHKLDRALLAKRTLLLTCTSETRQPFQHDITGGMDDTVQLGVVDRGVDEAPIAASVATEEADTVLYERYYENLNSFATPDEHLAPPPDVIAMEYRVCLVQAGRVVDSYDLSAQERILSLRPVYFQADRSAGSRATERRVFVLCSTVYVDKRGEDTQGNGRLLLLGLDYSLFEGDIDNDDKDEKEDEKPSGDAEATTNEATDEVGTPAANTERTSKKRPHSLISGDNPLSGDRSRSSRAQQNFLGSIQPKLRLLWTGAGPATAITQFPAFHANASVNLGNSVTDQKTTWSNYVAATVGSTVYIYRFHPTSKEMEQVAFYFAPFYISSISVIKNYLFISDIFHSVHFLAFRESDSSLHLVAKDFDLRMIKHTEFLVDNHRLGMLGTDDQGQLTVFYHDPKALESISGTRLLSSSNFHLGSEVTFLRSHENLYPDDQTISRKNGQMTSRNHGRQRDTNEGRYRKGSTFLIQSFGSRMVKQPALTQAYSQTIRKSSTLVGTMDGSLGILTPLEERTYKRLLTLQRVMNTVLPTIFALNPKEFRYFYHQHLKSGRMTFNQHTLRSANDSVLFLGDSSNGSSITQQRKVVLDGTVLFGFLRLDAALQEELATLIGTTAFLIRENLREIDVSCAYF